MVATTETPIIPKSQFHTEFNQSDKMTQAMMISIPEQSASELNTPLSSSISLSSTTTTISPMESGSFESFTVPKKPPRQFHKYYKQMTGPVASTSSTSSLLRQPIRIAQPPSQQQQQHYATFNHQQHLRNNQTSLTAPTSNSSSTSTMTTTFHSNPADGTTTFPHYSSVPALSNHSLQRPNASSSAFVQPPLHSSQAQQQRRRDSVDSEATTNNNQQKSNSLNALMETAVAQQRQIDANSCELEENRRLIASTIATPNDKNAKRSQRAVGEQVVGLRTKIAHDEREMARLGAIQREARHLAHHNQVQRRELTMLEGAYSQDDVQLRMAVGKVDALRKQLDLLYQRRASAASAAIAQQRKVNGDLASNPTNSLTNGQPQTANGKVNGKLMSQLQQQQRPQASVGPFQFSNLQKEELEEDMGKCSLVLPSYDQIDSAAAISGKYSTEKPSTMTHQQQQHHHQKKTVRAPPPPFCASTSTSGLSTFGKDMTNKSNLSINETHEQRLARGKPDQLSLRADSLTAIKRRSWAQADPLTTPNGGDPNENIWRYVVEEQKKGRTHISFADIIAAKKPSSSSASTSAVLRPAAPNGSVEKLRYRHSLATASATLPQSQQQKPRPKPIVEVLQDEEKNADCAGSEQNSLEKSSEKMSIVPAVTAKVTYTATYVQTKQPTETRQEKKEPKTEQVQRNCAERKELSEERMAPKATQEEDEDDLETLKDESVNVEIEERNKSEEMIRELESKKKVLEEDIDELIPEPEEEMLDDTEEVDEEQEDDEMEEPPQFTGAEIIDEMGGHNNEEASSTTTDEASTISGDEPAFDEASTKSIVDVKGILRPSGQRRNSKHVVFDQLVLFLDVAYEGEFEMLVELAANIPDISVSNAEGITALHNAICAGNHDIVKFLIDNNADVNALDSDGWSPLHCAASCNNLVMLKQFIENGACVFATTLSKGETASMLFDSTHEFVPCAEYIELVEKCMGVVNDGKVYAAYSYDAEQDDELSFEEGDELRVVSRPDDEEYHWSSEGDECWWLCEHTSATQKERQRRGLVPRNFLGLFPIWRHRHRHNFQNFELIPVSNGNSVEEMDEGTTAEQSTSPANNCNNSARELSTYA